MSPRLVPPPAERAARRRSLPTVRSPGAVFLGFAESAWREASLVVDVARGPEKFRAAGLRLSAVGFAMAALEAHAVAIHQCFFARELSRKEVLAWRRRPLLERMSELLPKRAASARRQRLLRDVVELHDVIRQPPPFQVAEQIDLFEHKTQPSGADFWYGSAVWVRRDVPRVDDEGFHKPAELPRDPLEVEEHHALTALLVVLEHVILLDRHYKGWAAHPLTTRTAAGDLTASAWFAELRAAYTGPHASYFRRIVV